MRIRGGVVMGGNSKWISKEWKDMVVKMETENNKNKYEDR